MIRVLIADSLAPFLRETEVPADLTAELIAESAPVPEGDYAGILPLLTRRLGTAELGRLPALRVISNFAVGYDNVDLEAAARRDIAVCNTPDVLTGATAELTWALILAAARRLGEGERRVRSGQWSGWAPRQLLGMGLDGKVLGIVGAGRIGQEVGRRAGAFGMRVVYWSRSRKPAFEAETGAIWTSPGALFATADVVSVHLAMSRESDGFVDARLLATMKPSAVLVNTSRGAVVDEDALIAALESGAIRSCGLDVYATEPRVPESLRRLENVVLLPHLGSATEEARWGMWQLAWDSLVRGVRGEPLSRRVV